MPASSPPPQTPGYARPSLDDSDSDRQHRSPMPARSIKSPPSEATTPAPPTPAPNYSRPAIAVRSEDHTPTQTHAPSHTTQGFLGHRPRQRSQGYFEPSLSSMAAPPSPRLNPAHMAAQAAYAQSSQQHIRKRSTTIPAPNDTAAPATRPPPTSPPLPSSHSMTFRTNGMTYQNNPATRLTAAPAGGAAFPRSPLTSPGLELPPMPPQHPQLSPRLPTTTTPSPAPELQKVPKEKSKMKLFSSKPKKVDIDKAAEKKHTPLPSPGKIGIGITSSQALNRMMNQSTTSLVESTITSSGAASMYSSANASTSTLIPGNNLPQEKEKHKHHFLSRTKNKLKDKDDHALPLSSASSNSRLADPSATQPLYSFAPSSPVPGSTFPGSVTGLDLRHGGRHLRRAKKEEKAAAFLDPLEPAYRERNASFSTERSDWPVTSSMGSTPNLTTPSSNISHAADMMNLGREFGVNGLTPDDAWPLLKARVLLIFEGEDPRPPVEEFNALVVLHIRRCVHKRSPIILIEDLNELLATGFGSLDQTLRHVPDERLIPHLVEMWLVVFTTILPFVQAVFLPLDLEFRGAGIMTAAAAAEFWGVMLPDEMNTKSPTHRNLPMLGELEVRRITLLMFRDIVILPRYDSLMAIFSRLSLENLNAGLESPGLSDARPGTASSHETLLSAASRSRAASSTSAGSFSASSTLHPPPPSHHPSSTSTATLTPTLTSTSISASTSTHNALRAAPMDSAKVTETIGRMLQCVSVLVSLQSADDAQDKMGRLSKELKYNWLGRGRTGRQRQGFVGPRGGGLVGGLGGGVGVGA